MCSAAAALRVKAPNLDGEYMLLERTATDDGKLLLEGVEVGAHDIMAANGVLHLLEKVIVPDAGQCKLGRSTRENQVVFRRF